MNDRMFNPLLTALLATSTATVFLVSTLMGRADEWGDIEITSFGDIAFTEPVELIKVACGEIGIVGKVHVKRGARVERHDLLLDLDRSVLEASRKLAVAKARSTAKLNAARVEYQQKNTRYQKLVQLLRENAGSQEEVERANADVQVANENVVALQEEMEQNQLELNQIEARIERRRVRSPIAGDVVDIRRKQGEFVSHSDPHVATVVCLNQLRVVFHLPTAQAHSFQQGDRIDVLLIESHQFAHAILEYVAPITSAESGRVRIEVLIDNADGQFRSGVRCQMVDGSARQSPVKRMNR